MAACIAVLNAGSSSVKFAIYEAAGELPLLLRGQIEGIEVSPRLKVADASGALIAEKSWQADGFDHASATWEIITVVRSLIAGAPIVGVGHRVVHGGTRYNRPVRITSEVVDALADLVPLAPLHQPHNLAPIQAIINAAPHIPQVACFDTAFHRTQSHVAQAFALPRRISDDGVRRYGFHGISYEYLVLQLRDLDPRVADNRVVFAHLGNGASLCAVHEGRSVASTMGFTAVDGLMMGTRCGAMDPGVILHMLQHYKMDARAIEDVIYRQSGLLGVSGISSDMRALRASSDPRAAEATALFVYRIVREIGSMTAALGGLDALVFSGGIGEHDAATRAEVMEASRWTGARLDVERNARGPGRISTDDSRVMVWVIPTDEERMIARRTALILT